MKTFKEITEAVKKAKATKNEIVFHGTEGTPQPENKPVKEEVEAIEEATPYYNKPSFLKNMGRIAKQERLAREKKEAEAKQKPVKEEAESVDEGATGAKPGWMLRQDPALAKKLKDQQERKKFVAGEPSKPVKEEAELEEATKYVVHYTDSKGQHVNSSKAFDDKKKADAHADKGNKIDKVGGKYTVKPMQNEDNVNFDNEGNLMAEKKSYTEFMSQLLEYEVDKNGRYVHKGNYGSAYKDPEGADDADDKPKKAAGRKVGSKVGPKKNLGNSKLHTK